MPVGRRVKLETSSAPTMMRAISAAATPAIQNGPVGTGRVSANAERTRADSAGRGGPLIASNSLLISSRKLSRVTSDHLLEGQVGAQLLRGPVDSGFGRSRRDAQRARDLVERHVEIEIEDERQALVGAQLGDRAVEVGPVLLRRLNRPLLWFDLRDLRHRPPPAPPRLSALVGDDGEEPGPQRALVAARSEERRVGKECRSRCAADQLKKKYM